MCSDTCQKQGFQVFLFVSRTPWVVLKSEMDWTLRCFSLAGPTPYHGLCKFLHSLGIQQCLKMSNSNFYKCSFHPGVKVTSKLFLEGFGDSPMDGKVTAQLGAGQHTGPSDTAPIQSSGSLTLPSNWRQTHHTLVVKSTGCGQIWCLQWLRDGQGHGAAAAIPQGASRAGVGSKTFPKVRFSTCMQNLVGNKSVFLELPYSIQDFWQACANIQHSQGSVGTEAAGWGCLCCWHPGFLAFILLSKQQ